MTLPFVADANTYGGTKADYAPVEDASTDLSAAVWNDMICDVSGMTQTACRAWRSFVGHATTPAEPASNAHGAVWGNALSDLPTVAKAGTGIYDITWSANVVDDLGVSRSLSLRRGWACVEGAVLYHTTVTITGANTARVRVFNTAASSDDAAGVTITVFVI